MEKFFLNAIMNNSFKRVPCNTMFFDRSSGALAIDQPPTVTSFHKGATGFDTIALREEASRGLLAHVKLGYRQNELTTIISLGSMPSLLN